MYKIGDRVKVVPGTYLKYGKECEHTDQDVYSIFGVTRYYGKPNKNDIYFVVKVNCDCHVCLDAQRKSLSKSYSEKIYSDEILCFFDDLNIQFNIQARVIL